MTRAEAAASDERGGREEAALLPQLSWNGLSWYITLRTAAQKALPSDRFSSGFHILEPSLSSPARTFFSFSFSLFTSAASCPISLAFQSTDSLAYLPPTYVCGKRAAAKKGTLF